MLHGFCKIVKSECDCLSRLEFTENGVSSILLKIIFLFGF